jgi:hypothetical protein
MPADVIDEQFSSSTQSNPNINRIEDTARNQSKQKMKLKLD